LQAGYLTRDAGNWAMTTAQNTEQAVLGILRHFSARRGAIDSSLRIHEDLRIAGDDAADLINRIHNEFGTSFDGFEFDEYFPNETEAIFYLLLIPLGLNRKKSISVRHLVEVVNAGKWFEEAAQSR
jgi:Protein of unknown function (DUF1493)